MASAGANDNGERRARDEDDDMTALLDTGRNCWNARVVVMMAKVAISVARLSRLSDMWIATSYSRAR